MAIIVLVAMNRSPLDRVHVTGLSRGGDRSHDASVTTVVFSRNPRWSLAPRSLLGGLSNAHEGGQTETELKEGTPDMDAV